MKKVYYSKEATDGLLKGIDKVAKAVRTTLGASGHNVMIENPNSGFPIITNDGVTVAKSIDDSDPLVQQGIKLLKQVTGATDDIAGDGTSTACVLASEIIKQGVELKNKKGVNPILMKRGMDYGVKLVNLYLDKIAIPVTKDTIVDVATISANGDKELGELIAKAFNKVGLDGVVTHEETVGRESYVEFTDGFKFDRGLMSPFFATDPVKLTATLENPFILISDLVVKDLTDFGVVGDKIPLLESIIAEKRPFLLIVDNMEVTPLQQMIKAKLKDNIPFFVVQAPEFGDRRVDVLGDIAALTGGKYISRENGMKMSDITLEDLGQADKVFIEENYTTIIGGKGKKEDLEERIKQAKEKLANENEEYGIKKSKQRIARLTGGVATIYIGANSEVELGEKMYRVQDAINAVQSSLEEGVVGGGGSALLHFDAKELIWLDEADKMLGAEIVFHSLSEPYKAILENGGLDSNKYSYNTDNDDVYYQGVNVLTGKQGNMFDMGIIDPVKTIKTALSNAVSIAGTLLTTTAVVVYEENKTEIKDLNQLL